MLTHTRHRNHPRLLPNLSRRPPAHPSHKEYAVSAWHLQGQGLICARVTTNS